MKNTILFFALLSLLLLGSCSPRVIKVGVAVPLSGSATGRGQEILNAVLLVAEEVNRAGGIKGRKVEIYVQDDKDIPEEGVIAAHTLLKQGVVGVIGHYSSDVTLAALPTYVSAKTALVSPSVALSRVPEEGHHFFRTLANNSLQAKAASEFINQSNYQRVMIVHNPSEYGKNLAEELESSLKSTSIQLKTYVEDSVHDILDQIMLFEPELVFYAGGYRDASLFLQRLHEAGSNAEFMGGNTLYDKEFIRLAGLVHTDKVWLVANPIDQQTPFYQAYQQRFGPPGFLAAHAYDAIHLLLSGVEKSEHLRAEDIVRTLQSMNTYPGLSGQIILNPEMNPPEIISQKILKISAEGRFETYDLVSPRFASVGQVVGTWAFTALPETKLLPQ